MDHDRSSFYAGYTAWKSWGETDGEPDHSEGYRIEMARAGVTPGSRILEIGFGRGDFLAWAKRNGYEIEGVELIPELVAAARENGHIAHVTDGKNILANVDGEFSLIVLFDVLEHLDVDEIGRFLMSAQNHLAGTGKILARFPNGASPFGRFYQYGDLTHITVLTAASLDQLARNYGMRIVGHYNAARYRSAAPGIRSARIVQFLVFLLRDIIQYAIGIIYSMGNIPLDPNISVVVMKQDAEEIAQERRPK